MITILLILTGMMTVAHLLPMIIHPHWIFRMSEYGRKQIFILQLIVIVCGFLFIDEWISTFWLCEGILIILVLHNAYILYPYTSWYRVNRYEIHDQHSSIVTILSANVYQFNKEYERMIQLINEINPDILLTMESNQDWEDALAIIEEEYPHCTKVPLENCYGMHFYTKLKVEFAKVHYFVADDLPSIEASLYTEDGIMFTFFGVHPPPPSPTEEENSKERDGDLMAIARRINEVDQPVIAIGDFNIVAWSRITKYFRKASGLIDARRGRGIVPTFHVKYPLFRFPIDLVFHSEEIIIENLESKEDIGSDHFPLFCQIFINLDTAKQDIEKESLEKNEKEEVNEMIEEGKKEDGNRTQKET